MTESPEISTVRAIQIGMQKASAPHLRGQHFKMHACVEADFRVAADLAPDRQVGLFAKPADYRAVLRFSNGSQKDDRKPDIHGLAVKLYDVGGDKVLPGEEDCGEHDFILADNPVFFIRSAQDYALFMQDFVKTAPLGQPPSAFIEHLQKTHPEDVPVLLGFRQQVQSNPLEAVYWSQTPYAFGADDAFACRYRIIPKVSTQQDPGPGSSHDYLRERMAEGLRPGGASQVLLFQVQIRAAPAPEVIDNPTVQWPEPFETVAEIEIPPQAFDTPDRRALGERLSFNPWRASMEHRPLGQVNEIRKSVYVASRAVRREAAAAPTGDLRLTEQELTAHIDDDFKDVVDRLQRTFGFLAHSKRGRATHTWGVAGKARARFIVAPEFPANDYFVTCKETAVILRHSSPGAREDDRARDGVAASLKFFPAGAGFEGPGELDVLMNAGRQLFVRSIRDFSTFVHASPDERKELVRAGIMMEPELIEAYRIRGSFTESRYHSWQCFEFFDAAGRMSYIRFRLIPGDCGPERGFPNAKFRADGAPSMDPLPDDPRAPDFLRQDWIYRVEHSNVSYILQAQLHETPDVPGPNPEVLNPARAWDETAHPWLDLCEIVVEEVIDDNDALSDLDLTPNRSPPCIRIPLATSPDQYASLGHARALVYPGARAVRRASERPQNN